MTPQELYAALLTLGMPVAYGEFTEPTEPPFITYQFAYDADLKADNRNYANIDIFQIEFYSPTKDLANEAAIEALLDANRLPYQKSEAWLDSEKLRQVIYEVPLIGG